MNVQQLRYVVAVSDSGSVSAAARELGVTQPVISRSIRAFEVEHGVSVFSLSGRRLVPTEAGRAVVASARAAIEAVDAVGQVARNAGGQAELVLATTPTNGLLLTKALSEVGRSHAPLGIRMCRADDAGDVVRKVESGEAEIGFSEFAPSARFEQLVVMAIAELDIVLVSPGGSDLPAAVTWDDVVSLPLILPSEGSGRRALINDMASHATGMTPQVSVVIEDRGSWIAAAQAGMGSFLSYRYVVSGHEGVELRPFVPPQRVAVGFVHRVGGISRAAALLVDLARAELARLASADTGAVNLGPAAVRADHV